MIIKMIIKINSLQFLKQVFIRFGARGHFACQQLKLSKYETNVIRNEDACLTLIRINNTKISPTANSIDIVFLIKIAQDLFKRTNSHQKLM